MKRSPWFPMWAGFQDDESFLAVSAEAELLYIRALARCKQLDQGSDGGQVGRLQLRRLCDRLDTPPADLAAELCGVALWVETGDGWHIPAYGQWNTSAEEERQARAESGKRGNHARWNHPGPFEDCTTCHPPVSPDESHPTRTGVRPESGCESDRSRKPSLDVDVDVDVDETRRDVDDTTPPYPPTVATPGGTATDTEVVALADQLVEALGIVGEPANQGERNYLARAVTRGWPDQHLLDEALAIGGRDDIRDHRAYLLAVLKRCANEDYHPPDGAPVAGRPERRPLLDDERPPCSTCHSTRWVDQDDGTVAPCPTCAQIGAPAPP